ncbi:MAG: hypothetical protein CEO22_83 [Candidatus Berkelbacteria bacterium Gr01-1014_85]|uniref:Ribonuclease J n=1 Tax=Candidatus Berkelbacteria bacterium Gr01-1014_85 TaxID=2017150 RepID=A0A554JDL5_9BACT|nr:MAG: hypothetical protein CEO22_83 [Candidatus Berkelbacteria bacterium Gr01-1014_85]
MSNNFDSNPMPKPLDSRATGASANQPLKRGPGRPPRSLTPPIPRATTAKDLRSVPRGATIQPINTQAFEAFAGPARNSSRTNPRTDRTQSAPQGTPQQPAAAYHAAPPRFRRQNIVDAPAQPQSEAEANRLRVAAWRQNESGTPMNSNPRPVDRPTSSSTANEPLFTRESINNGHVIERRPRRTTAASAAPRSASTANSTVNSTSPAATASPTFAPTQTNGDSRKNDRRRRMPMRRDFDNQPAEEAHFAMTMQAMEDTTQQTPATTPQPAKLHTEAKTGKLRLIPLGGLGEIGKNIMAYETDNDLIVVDAGMTFPDESMPGVDLVIPDITYVQEHVGKLRGLVITHGHEDHIGGIPYIWPKMKCPIYASGLTAGLIKIKLTEHGIDAPIHIIQAGERIRLGDFEIEPVRVTHSIPDALAFAIRTPQGLFAHFTDWKIDHTPISGEPFDFVRVAELSREGVKLLLSESTNIELPGYQMSESVLSETFDSIFKNAKGRVVFTTFASMINRIQQAIDATVKYGRKLAISGRSLEKYIDESMRLGFLKAPQGLLVDLRTASRLPDHQITFLTTGSQGEEFSALSRIASGEHRHIQVKRGDTVVISASIIPGNEASVFDVVNNLYKQGAHVIYGKAVDIHVSGHANEEELKMIMAMMKPEYFLPIHGEFRHLVKHGRMAQRLGVDPGKIFILENGGVIEFDADGVGRVSAERVQAGQVLVDGLGIGDVGNIVLRDRQAMAKDGIFVIILTVDKQSGNLISSPDIISRGFVYMRSAEDLIYKARQEVRRMFTNHNSRYPMNYDYIRKSLREELAEYLYEHTERQPMVIPVIIEV